MHIYTYQPELFAEEGVPTEATAYRLLQANPVAADVNYLAAPWSILLRERTHDEINLQLNGGFTICQHCYFREIIPTCIRIGLDTLFAAHVESDWNGASSWKLKLASVIPVIGSRYAKSYQRLRQFRVLPFPHLAIHGAMPQVKDLWYSYIGTTTHPVRRRLLQLTRHSDTVIKERDRWHFDVPATQRDAEKSEYQEVMARSRFSLCPRGFGPSTIRFWESLQAGAIPVLIADQMSLPDNFDWDSAIVRIPESRTRQLDTILSSITPQQEARLRENGRLAAQRFLGDNLISIVRYVYDTQRRAA